MGYTFEIWDCGCCIHEDDTVYQDAEECERDAGDYINELDNYTEEEKSDLFIKVNMVVGD